MANFRNSISFPALILSRGLLGLFVCVLFCSIAKADIKEGFIHGYWFDNNYSDVMGSSPGTACRTISISEDGLFGQAILCDGGYVRLEDSHGTGFGIADGRDGKMTIMCWYNPSSAATSERVLISNSNWDSGKNPGVVLDAQWKGGPFFNIGDGSDRIDINANIPSSVNAWQFAAITADLTTNEAYLYYGTETGTLQQAGSANLQKIDTLLSSYKWYIGEDYKDYYFYGLIDEVGFWNRALSFDEINQIYTAQQNGTPLGNQLSFASSAATTQAGAYTNPSTWEGGIVPSIDANVEINHALTAEGRTFNGEAVIGENGSLSASGCVFVGHSIDANGKLTINGGDNVFSGNSANGLSSSLIIGFQGGTGEFVLNNGSVTVSGRTYVGYEAGGETSFTQTNGTFNSTQDIYIAASANNVASLEISNGNLTTTGAIHIGTGTDSTGLMTVSGGNVTAKILHLGRAGAGDSAKMVITGGVVEVTDAIYGSSSSNSGNLYISGTGQLVLNSTNTGNAIRELTSFQIEGSGNDGTGALLFKQSLTGVAPITLTNNATIGVESGATFTQKAAISETQPSSLTVTGGGTLTLTATNTFTGGLTIQNGTLICSTGKNQSNSQLGTGKITIESGAKLDLQYSNQLGYGANSPNDLLIRGTLIPYTYTHVKNISMENGLIEAENGYNSGATGLDFATRTATLSASGNSTIKSRININSGANVTIDVDSDSLLTIEGVIKSTGGFTKTGNGKLELSADNTYTGATKVTAGELVFSGSVLPVSAMSATGGSLVIGTEGKDITVKRGSSIKASGGAVRVDGNLIFEAPGSGNVTCDGSWTGNGSITLDGGYIRVGTNFNTTTGIKFNGGSILNNDNDGVLASDLTIAKDGSTMQAGWKKSLTLKGALKGSASLTVGSDSGWLIFSGNGSNYEGSLLVKGNMRIGVANTDSSDCAAYIGGQVINLNGGTIQNNNNNLTIKNDLNVMSETGFKTGWSKSITLTGNVTGSGKLKLVSDSGWLILKTHSDNDAFTGPFQTGWASTSSRGQTRLAAEQPLGANAGVLYNYGYLDMNGFSQKFKGVVDDGANNKKGRIYNTTDTKSVVTFDITNQNLSYAGTIESNVELIVNATGAGVQTLNNGGSSFTGNAAINGGTIRMTGKGSSGKSPIGKVSDSRYVYVNSGAELVFANQDVLANAHNYAPINFVVDGGKISNEGAYYNFLQNTTFKNGGQLYASDGSATWKAFKLLNVTVARNKDDTAGAPVLFSSDPNMPNATIAFGDISSVIEAGNSVSTVYVAEITSADKSVNDNVSDLVISAIVADPVYKTDGALKNATEIMKTGAGTMEFTASNTYTGKTSVTEGTLRLTDDAIVTHGLIVVDEAATLEFNISDNQTNKLTVSSTNAISSAGSLVKIGEGTLQIDASSPDLVNANLMRVSSGRLDMKEYFTGAMKVGGGATLSPGNSIGTLTVNGSYSQDKNGTLLLEVGKDDQGEIVVDQLIVNGNAAFASGSIINISLDSSSGLVGNDTFSDVPILTADNAAVIFDNLDNVVIALQSYYFTDLTPTLLGNQILLSGRLDPNAVPEPSTWALLILGVAGLMYVRKRTRK